MVSDRYESYLNMLLIATEKQRIKWRPIEEYIKTYTTGELAQYIQIASSMEFGKMYYDRSFFAKKDGYVIALLNYEQESAKDGFVSECLELVGVINNSSVKHFPEYILGGFARIHDAVLRYWESKDMDYSLETSDRFELLDAFIEWG